MIQPNKILAVDDEPDIRAMYEDLLGELGFEVRTVGTIADAVAALDDGDWSVVLLDQRLRGQTGGDEGLTLIEEAKRRSPEARIIVVTGYVSDASAAQALEAGAYDYIEKTQNFDVILRAKVRNAMELARERWLNSLSDDQVRARLDELWLEAKTTTSKDRKGRVLEELLELLLKQIPGFVVASRERSRDEEFDLVVRNESTDPLWAKESPYLLVECKNWAGKVGPTELDRFINKLDRRYGRCRVGLLVSVNGWTEGVRSTLAAKREQDSLVMLIDGTDLEGLIQASDRLAALTGLHQRATLGATG